MITQRDIILLSFPFSDLRNFKVRPAIVLSNDKYNKRSHDLIAVPLTSNLKEIEFGILLSNNDLEKGKLIVDRNIKVDRIFSVEKKLIKMVIGKVSRDVHEKIKHNLYTLIN